MPHRRCLVCSDEGGGYLRLDCIHDHGTGKHSSKNQAGWVASEAINSIVTKPSLGDFGLTAKLGGNWKVDNVEVYYDGKHWVASRTYTKSGDAKGWDQELYGEVK